MALNKKISELDQVASPDGTEFFPVVKSGLNYRMTIAQIKTWIGAASTSVAGLMTANDKSKLDGIAAGATANNSNAYLRDRGNHTGTQPAGTIDGLANVATSGQYGDLAGRPTLTPAALGAAPAGHVGQGGTGAHPAATETQAGFLSAQGAQLLLSLGARVSGNFVVSPYQQASAAGTDSATATEITATFVRVNSLTAGTDEGIRVPDDAVLGMEIRVKSGVADPISLYPPTGGQINFAGVDVPLTIPAYGSATIVCNNADGLLWDQF